MTDEDIKAAISSHFVQLIANRSGFKCSRPDPDHGCDLAITRATAFDRGGRTRFLDSGKYLDLQLKCTCENRVIRTATTVSYDLEVKAFNDLIDRRDSGAVVPLYLVLVILPDDPDLWVSVSPNELVVRRGAYWYQPAAGAQRTANTSSIRIEIPETQAVGLSFISDRYQETYP